MTNIELHIERLILDGVALGPGGPRRLQMAVEAELTWLLKDGGLSPALLSGGAVPRLQVGAIQVGDHNNPSQLGTQLAQVVHGGLTNSRTR